MTMTTTVTGKVKVTPECLCGQDVFVPSNRPHGWALCKTVLFKDRICERSEANQEHARKACCIKASTTTTTTVEWSTVVFQMRGKSGQERILVTVDGEVTSQTLTTNNELFQVLWPKSGAYYVTFENDAVGRDVYFQAVDPVTNSLEHVKNWQRWGCGSAKENVRCNSVRSGTFAWRGIYKITPQVEIMELECADCDECAWGGSDSKGQRSLGGGGHSASDCMLACLNAVSCNYAARSISGYCHYFETCTPGSGTKWSRWKKSVKGGADGTIFMREANMTLDGPAERISSATRGNDDDVPLSRPFLRGIRQQ